MNRINKVLELFRSAIRNNKAEDAGYGMYNIDLSWEGIKNQADKYNHNIIFQAYPYNTSDDFGRIYVLAYYEDKKYIWDNDCFEFENFSKEEQDELIALLEATIAK